MWAVYGVADAILVGDALQALAVRVLAQDPHAAALPAMDRLAGCMIELCEGQSTDCAFEHRTDVTLVQCEAMAMGKTGALFGSACAIGALYAGAAPGAVDALDEFGRQLGLAFQLVDDLLGIWGDPAVTGKPAGADLLARKKSLPVVAALTSGTAAGKELAAAYNTGLCLWTSPTSHASRNWWNERAAAPGPRAGPPTATGRSPGTAVDDRSPRRRAVPGSVDAGRLAHPPGQLTRVRLASPAPPAVSRVRSNRLSV